MDFEAVALAKIDVFSTSEQDPERFPHSGLKCLKATGFCLEKR